MLSTKVADLWHERSVSVEDRDRKLAALPEMKKDFHGTAYDAAAGTEDEEDFQPINYGYGIIGLLQPAVVANNPRAIVGSKRPEVQAADAKAIQLGGNRWIKEVSLRDTLDKLLVDYAMCYGIAHITREPAPGEQEHSDPIYWPQVNRLPQDQCFWDAEAKSWETKRFAGHDWFIDLEDLKSKAREDAALPEDEREGWNAELIETLSPGERSEGWAHDDSFRKRKSGLREQVQISEIWIPEIVLESTKALAEEHGKTPSQMGYHGTIYYLAYGVYHDPSQNVQGDNPANEKRAYFVRAPQPYYGSRLGPYALFGAHEVPSESFPLGMLTAAHAQIQSVNEIGRSNHEMARDYKRLQAVEEQQKGALDKLRTTDHKGWVTLPMPDTGRMTDAVVGIEIGGLTQQGLSQFEYEKEIADQALGLTEAQRGNVAGGTATESAIAEGSSSRRIEWHADKFERCTLKLLEAVFELLWMDDEVVFPLGSDAEESDGVSASLFIGGRPDAKRVEALRRRFPEARIPDAASDDKESDSGATFSDLELTIEVGSMGRRTEAQRRGEAMALQQFAVDTAPILPSLANVIGLDGVESFLSALQDRTGVPFSMFYSAEQLSMAAQMEMQPEAPQPRLSRTTGGQAQYGGSGGGPQTRKPAALPNIGGSNPGHQGQSTGQQSQTGQFEV